MRIQAPRYNELLTRLLAMKVGAPSPELSSDIIPALVLESDRPEWQWLLGVSRMCENVVVAAGGAGLRSEVLVTPIGNTSTLVVVESIQFVGSGAAADYEVLRPTADAAGYTGTPGGIPKDSRDTRRPVRLFTKNSAAAIAGVRYYRADALNTGIVTVVGTPFVLLSGPAVSGPATALILRPTADNVSLEVNVGWYERPYAPDEGR